MEILNLNTTDYAGKTVRVCVLQDGRKAASVFDIIGIALGVKNPHKTFSDLVKANPEDLTPSSNFETTSPEFSEHQFPGQGQRKTPVATARGLVTMLMLLPGPNAAAFRAKASEVLVRYLGGDESLIHEIRANGEIARADPQSMQAFAVTSEDARRKFLAETHHMEVETQRMEAETKQLEIKFLQDARAFLADVRDPRLVQTLSDSINNQMLTLMGGGGVGAAPGASVTAIEAPAPAHKTIDQILMARAANYRSLSTDVKGKIGKLVVGRKGKAGVEKVQKLINGEIRHCNAYPAEWEEEILEIAQTQGVVAV